MTILVTGAGGTISTSLLNLLAATSTESLRALVRDPGKAPTIPGVEVAVGDLTQPDSLTTAFEGVRALWLLTAAGPDAPHQSSNALDAARRAGVGHIVRLSAIGAAHDAPTRNGRLHALSDAELIASGIPYTIVKPSAFDQNLLGLVHEGTLYHSWGDGRVGLIDARDIAEFAAHVLRQPEEHVGRTYTVTGPESISLAEAAAELSDGTGREIKAQQVPSDAVVAGMLGAGLSPWFAEVMGREYAAAYASGWGDFTTDAFETVVGRRARTVAEFGRDHSGAFEPAVSTGTTSGSPAAR